MRHQLMTLITVFLSLSMGLVLGISLVERGGILKHEKTLVNHLQHQFNHLAQVNHMLRLELGAQRATVHQQNVWIAQHLGLLYRGSLSGLHVVLLQGNSSTVGHSIRILLEAAGASVQSRAWATLSANASLSVMSQHALVLDGVKTLSPSDLAQLQVLMDQGLAVVVVGGKKPKVVDARITWLPRLSSPSQWISLLHVLRKGLV